MSFQQIVDAVACHTFELLLVERGDGGDDVTGLGGTVTHHDHLVQQSAVLPEVDVHVGTGIIDFQVLLVVARVGDDEGIG